MDAKTMGRIGGWALVYFAATTMMAVIVSERAYYREFRLDCLSSLSNSFIFQLGTSLTMIVHPGDPATKIGASAGTNANVDKHKHVKITDTLMDVMR